MSETEEKLEGGAYEVLRQRLQQQGQELKAKLDKLNAARRATFGGAESTLVATDRILTDNACIARDMVAIGTKLVFGYDVYIGLKKETSVEDVLCVYDFKEGKFTKADQALLRQPAFEKAFKELYAYYKHARFQTFYVSETHLLMVFATAKDAADVRVFKWALDGKGAFVYVDDRGDRDARVPAQHDFEWERSTRDQHVHGKFPHVSLNDEVFVECVGGDLTLKVEDNTDVGNGFYTEPVDHKDQKLDDADILYVRFDAFYLLKIRPYREDAWRYFVVNVKQHKAWRVDDLGNCAVRLPDGDGVIFPTGCYLERGELVAFNLPVQDRAGLRYRKTIISPNGEDFLYVFYSDKSGDYVLLPYNLIEKTVQTPIVCHGYALYDDGSLIAFKAGTEPAKSHQVQLWKTPFVKDDAALAGDPSSPLARLGNRDLVKGIAALSAIQQMTQRQDVYLGLYHDLVRVASDTMGVVHWLSDEAAEAPKTVLEEIQQTAKAAIDEHAKVVQLRKHALEELTRVDDELKKALSETAVTTFDAIEKFVSSLDVLRLKRGQFVTLKGMRFMDVARVQAMEAAAAKAHEDIMGRCVQFLLRPDALRSYDTRLDEIARLIPEQARGKDLKETGKRLGQVADGVQLLLDLVAAMPSADAADAAKIVESISTVVARANQTKAIYKTRLKDVSTGEVKLEFAAQFRLLDQAATSYLDQADSVERCDELLSKAVLKLEELEGRFAELDEFLADLTQKREEICAAFAAKKQQLEDARAKRIEAVAKSADRVLAGIAGKATKFSSLDDLNAYFAADPMVEKARQLAQDLRGLGANVQAEGVDGKLKSLQQAGVRQLRDKADLFADGADVVALGDHRFLVNRQELDLTLLVRDGVPGFSVGGTDYFDPIRDTTFLGHAHFLDQPAVSETPAFGRAEYLAYRYLESGKPVGELQALRESVRAFMAGRYTEGYEKGVHDEDAARFLAALKPKLDHAGALVHSPEARAEARLYWTEHGPSLAPLAARIAAYGALSRVRSTVGRHPAYLKELSASAGVSAGEHLYDLLLSGDATLKFPVSREASQLLAAFGRFLGVHEAEADFFKRLTAPGFDLRQRFAVATDWIGAVTEESLDLAFLPEAAAMLACQPAATLLKQAASVDLDELPELKVRVEGLVAPHGTVKDGAKSFKLHDWLASLSTYVRDEEPKYHTFQKARHTLLEAKKKALGLEAFKPKTLSSFVRNRLIDTVYLKLLGANLAKQIGAYGDKKRTDLMGLLLLISPPGYGKTTLVEYAAERLGLAFVKINGPALGHEATSLDPAAAPNAAATLEIEKLNLALALGQNVLLCIDDIQHLNPEFLQKFIALCDGQRKIEGVIDGKSRTYDLRGKRFAVVMAGNPYTESGDKFKIPDMLANRADTYNLGDMASGQEAAFRMSYLENCLTSHPLLAPLASRDPADLQALIRMAQGEAQGVELKSRFAAEEVGELQALLERLLKVQDVVLKVNQLYIASAGQDERFRTEPPFLLQGSYRSMNKITEKTSPVMNDKELASLIQDHYRFEAQLLTRGAEFNQLRFRELTHTIDEVGRKRIEQIREEFVSNLKAQDGQAGVREVAREIQEFAHKFDELVCAVNLKWPKAV